MRKAKKEHTKDTIQTNKTYKKIKKNVDDRLKRTIARFSSSPWSSIVVLVQKRMVPYAIASIIWRRIKKQKTLSTQIDDLQHTFQGGECS